MKITVDIEDFYLDQKSEIEPVLKKYLIDSIVIKINDSIKKKVDDQIIKHVAEQVEKNMYKKIQLYIQENMDNGTFKSQVYKDSSYVDQELTLKEFIQNKFRSDSGWSSPNEIIKKLAKEFGDELKKRYDLLFATHIVSKLNENGLLKEDVAKMLLETNK
jgi:hypothetical protein